MSVNPVEATGFTPFVAPTLDTSATGAAAGTKRTGAEFGNLVLDGIDRLQQVQDRSDGLAVKAATGDLSSIHQYTIAATEAQVTTQLTVALRNRAIDAFNEIMRMPV